MRRSGWWKVVVPVVLLTVLAGLAWRFALREQPGPGPGRIGPSQSARVAEVVQQSQVQVVAGGDPQSGLVAGDGQVLTTLPPPGVTPVTVEGTPLVVDRLRGVAIGPAGATVGRPAVPLGSSKWLRTGDEVVVIPPERASLVATYVGEVTVLLAPGGLGQIVMDLTLPDGAAPVDRGWVLDRAGRLVGLISPERQASAPPGHAYAVAAEHVAELIEPPSPATGLSGMPVPKPTARPTPRPLPTVDESVRFDVPGDD